MDWTELTRMTLELFRNMVHCRLLKTDLYAHQTCDVQKDYKAAEAMLSAAPEDTTIVLITLGYITTSFGSGCDLSKAPYGHVHERLFRATTRAFGVAPTSNEWICGEAHSVRGVVIWFFRRRSVSQPESLTVCASI